MRRKIIMLAVAAALPSVAFTATAAQAPPVVFDGSFETGSYKPWNTPQCANYGHVPTTRTFGDFFIDRSRVGQGSAAGRFDLPADSAKLTRCEVFVPRTV